MVRDNLFVFVAIVVLGTGSYFYFTQGGPVLTGAPAPGAGETTTIRFSVDDEPNINRLSQIVAERKGFFAAEGVDVEFVPFTPSFRRPEGSTLPTEGEAIENGDIQMSRQQLPLLMRSFIEGEGTRARIAVGLEASNSVYLLVSRPEIASYEDLRGQTVAITGPYDGITLWTYELIEQNGLTVEEYTPKYIAGTQGRLDCLTSGECAAAALSQPLQFGVLEEGYNLLGITNEIEPLFYQHDVVDPAWATAHRDAVVGYIRAIGAANAFILDPSNREEMVQITIDYMEQPEDRVRQMLSYYWDPANRVLEVPPVIDTGNVQATIDLFAKYGLLTEPLPAPEVYVDPSYAAEAAGIQ